MYTTKWPVTTHTSSGFNISIKNYKNVLKYCHYSLPRNYRRWYDRLANVKQNSKRIEINVQKVVTVPSNTVFFFRGLNNVLLWHTYNSLTRHLVDVLFNIRRNKQYLGKRRKLMFPGKTVSMLLEGYWVVIHHTFIDRENVTNSHVHFCTR